MFYAFIIGVVILLSLPQGKKVDCSPSALEKVEGDAEFTSAMEQCFIDPSVDRTKCTEWHTWGHGPDPMRPPYCK